MARHAVCGRAPWAVLLLVNIMMMAWMTESTSIPQRPGSACRGVRSYDLAMASGGAYDFTTKATGTLRTLAAEEPPL